MFEEKMDKNLNIRVDQKTIELLENLKEELKTSKADIVRMSIRKFYNYVKKVNK